MADKVKGLFVVLDGEHDENAVSKVIAALKQNRYVLDAKPVYFDRTDQMNIDVAKAEMRAEILPAVAEIIERAGRTDDDDGEG